MRPIPVLLLVALALPGAAQAFVRSRTESGACLQWERRLIPWTMNARGLPGLGYERAHAAFARSFRTWEEVGCSDIAFRDDSPSPETRVGYAEGELADNLVIFRTRDCRDAAPQDAPCRRQGSCANEYDCWDHGSSVIGVTTTTFFRNTGEIVDADIEMNAAWFDFTDVDGPPCGAGETEGCVATDIQNTATHEIGHLLGLDHSPVRDATMFASAPRGQVSKRVLADDDVDGLCTIYPAGQKEPTYCDGFELEEETGCSCQSGAGAGEAALLLAGLGLLRRARSRGATRPSGG